MLQFVNLINGKLSTEGDVFQIFSPIDNKVLGEGRSLSVKKIEEVFEKSISKKENKVNLKNFNKLAKYIEIHKRKFIENIINESGYTLKDSEEIVDGVIEFINNFDIYIQDTEVNIPKSKFSYFHNIPRTINISFMPYGVIAAMTPQNGPLTLEITVILNALAAGNSIILRPSSQCVGIASLIAEGLVESFSLYELEKISIISCKATDFLSISYQKSDLIHYIGSSGHGKRILNDSLENNKNALVDGEGASVVIVDKDVSLKETVEACLDGIIRCNGQLCSTIRLIAVNSEIYDDFKKLLTEKLKNIKLGNPHLKSINIGPLFNEKQAQNLRSVAEKYELLSGEIKSNLLGTNYTSPVLCELTNEDNRFLSEEVFGPIVGVVSYNGDGWKNWLMKTVYKLNDAVFSNDEKFINEFLETSQSPRKVVNHDPTIESVFEPWGAYLPSGSNDVSYWFDKYRRSYQVVIESK